MARVSKSLRAQLQELGSKLQQKFALGLFVTIVSIGLIAQPVQAVELPAALNTTNNPHISITNTDELLLYENAQNLANHWSNLVIRAKTGKEQLQMMRQSGIFADDVKMTFDLGDKKYQFEGLSSPEADQFWGSIVDGLKKYRYNLIT